MIKKIHVVKYRKLQDMDFDLSKGINVISGTNGTCKTSLLHMVSNAYQAVTKKCDWLQDAACLDVIKQINSMTNPKIESLTKGDKTYNDPANGAKGTLFTVDYYGQASLEFRKHTIFVRWLQTYTIHIEVATLMSLTVFNQAKRLKNTSSLVTT